MKFVWDFGDGSMYSVYCVIVNVNELVISIYVFFCVGKFFVNVIIFNFLLIVFVVLFYSLVVEYFVENIVLIVDSFVRFDLRFVIF